MSVTRYETDSSERASTALRAEALMREHQRGIYVRTDRLFAWLLLVQWFVALGLAQWLSPLEWAGVVSRTHIHVLAAGLLGAAILSLPLVLVCFRPGASLTRQVVGLAQMLMGALLIHLTGGRLETHFHVFGSLALLAFYRDSRVLVSSSALVAVDHLVRGYVWPQSVYGSVVGVEWRWLEHSGWVIFIDVFLIWSCRKGVAEMRTIAERQAELETTTARIERTVEDRTAELREQSHHLEALTRQLEVSEADMRRAKESAESANRSKGQFLANMSHEIRTPMNAIVGMTRLALETELTPDQREYLDAVKTSADALLGIINDILDFSKIEAGKLDLETIPFSLSEVLDNTVRVFSWRAQEKGLQLTVRRAPEVPEYLVGDPGRLRQILINLVGNGIKFTDRGEVSASVLPSRGGAGEGEVVLCFSVRDTGIGIPADKQSSIFRAFEQADGSTTRKYGGTGLGLAIAQRLVEMMGGQLWVESQPGQGSTFHFTAVFARADAVSGRDSLRGVVPCAAPSRRLKVRNVLLVEDNVLNQKLAIRLLEKKGHHVTVANNGKQALAALERNAFDVILMDLQMPEMGGLEATAHIRANERGTGRHVPIVAMTAHALRGDEQRCLEAGMDGYVSKPIDSERLWTIIDALSLENTLQTASTTPIETGILDEEALLQRCGGDVETKSEIVQLFLEEYPSSLDAIRQAMSARRGDELMAAAHHLKGSAVNFGARRVVAAAQRLEQMGAGNHFAAAAETLEELHEALEELREVLAPAGSPPRNRTALLIDPPLSPAQARGVGGEGMGTPTNENQSHKMTETSTHGEEAGVCVRCGASKTIGRGLRRWGF